MLDPLRALRPSLIRAAVTGAFAAAAVAVPGSTALASSAPTPVDYIVIGGSVLRPVPERFVLPIRSYRLTGEFGETSYHWRSVHTGLDFAAPSGTPIRSVAAGRVVARGYDGRYGNKTVIRLKDGTQLWYCHQADSPVQVGDRVRVGQVIGHVGSTGNVTGPHLHLEVRPTADRPVDPARWLRKRGLTP